MVSPGDLETKRQQLEEKRRMRREARRRRVVFYVICAVVGLLLLVGSAIWSYQTGRTALFGLIDFGPKRGPIVNVLVLGIDSGLEGPERSDTMILFSIDHRTGQIGALSIPRDTRVRIPGRRGFDRVNAAHAHGGPKLAVSTVERLLNVDVDYYVRIDYDGFEAIVDAIGGVVIDVERRMRYVDEAQGFRIDLLPGVQRLDGNGALQYVRFRSDSLGDVALVDPIQHQYAGRVQRQLKLVQAIARQALSARNMLNAPELVNELRAAVDTDMPIDEAIRLATLVIRDMRVDGLSTAVLPGVGQTVGGASYWVVDEPRAREVVNKVILRHGPMVRVEVLNGNGIDGMAAAVADRLREQGFEVVAVGNADRFDYAETSAIARNGNLVDAGEVAKAIGERVSVATADASGTRRIPFYASDADVTLILGRDMQI